MLPRARDGDEVELLLPGQKVNGRQDTMAPALTVRLSSPLEGVIQVAITHHAGTAPKSRDFALCPEGAAVTIEEREDCLIYRSRTCGSPRLHEKGAWGIEYRYDGRYLTRTGYRAMAYSTMRRPERANVQEALEISVGECVYGLGERFTPSSKTGRSWRSGTRTAAPTASWPTKNVPFYLTSRGYGVFVNEPGERGLRGGQRKRGTGAVCAPGRDPPLLRDRRAGSQGRADALRASDRPARAAARLVDGAVALHVVYHRLRRETVLSFVQGMADRNLPLSVFHFDCGWMQSFRWCDFEWDKEVFPDPEGLLKKLHERGLRVCVWINPYIAQDSPLFREGQKAGYLVKKTDGSVWQTDLWAGGHGMVDFTNPGAWAWYQRKLKKLLDQGVDCFKTDFGERVR
jgi:alpha-D-xyloside xylohydrolase